MKPAADRGDRQIARDEHPLPADFRVTPSEARDLLEATVRANMGIVPFSPDTIWGTLQALVGRSVTGGESYDAFVAQSVWSAGAEAVATFNPKPFAGVAALQVIDPSTVPI